MARRLVWDRVCGFEGCGWPTMRRKAIWRPKEPVVRRRNDRCVYMKRSSFSVFVDNLLDQISKRMMYTEFGRYGGIVDVFISRKIRKMQKTPFAFVRFKDKSGAYKAIEDMKQEHSRKDDYIGVVVLGKLKSHNEATRRMVTIEASDIQQDLLSRSIIAEIFQPIKFGDVVAAFEDLREEYGIEGLNARALDQ
ncbi:hypothetical protein PIB30_047502 [Stylosanthes scabra]|uniref:RRM domain-containing protein n=1 Tax=Stylosanthes scabra TaxID=79078 RepID=A0ABU6UI55_9FABA|nr:hypothetical protein [Stylosanthes scabra]